MGSVRHHPAQNDLIMLVTANTKNRLRIFENPAYAREAVETLYRVQELHPFFLYAFVIMPDHCHVLLKVPSPGSVSTVMKQFKAGVSHNIGIGPVWQSRFHVRVPDKASAALRYIHSNPVTARLVTAETDYLWSSASGRWDVTAFEIF